MINLSVFGGINIGKEYWFVSMSFNGLFAYHYETGKIRWIHRFKHIKINKIYLCAPNILKQGDELFFFPNNMRDIIVYNIRTNEETVIELPGLDDCVNAYDIVSILHQGKENNFIFPSNLNNGVYNINLLTKEAKPCEQWNNYIKNNNLLSAQGPFVDETEECIWMGFQNTNLILKLNKNLNILHEYKIPITNLKIHYFKCIEGKIWIIPRNYSNIYCWNSDTNEVKEYSYYDKNFMVKGIGVFEKIVECGKDLILINGPVLYNMRIQPEKEIIDTVLEYPINCAPMANSVYNVEKYNNLYYFFPRMCKELLVYNPQEHKFEGRNFEISKKDIPYYDELVEAELREKVLFEGETVINLRDMIKFLGEEK